MLKFYPLNNITKKLLICIVAALASVFVIASPAFACTGVYVGSDVSTNGTILIGRSNDTTPVNKPALVKVFGGSDGFQITEVVGSNGFR